MKEIYKGILHTITTDGITAHKTDGNRAETMPYYPERDITALAGEIDELTAWQILRDIARQAQDCSTPILPDHIIIDGESFILLRWSRSRDDKFIAPEGYSPVWALGATVFYTYLGCHVFQGLGGKGQSATAPVPTLRKSLPELSALIVRCLDHNSSRRPSLVEIAEIADANVARCLSLQSEFPPLKLQQSDICVDGSDSWWPEEME